ncbi:hypothetical protein P280DRAFT_471325 [Massarina eburnea CBS 473.64]|uniref:Uncharacterized protein n=1 Tax=Massarina eburnea CBS 473.64 TaxID=1395130 RepID=A0A6A6RRE8_9PLEO|nr:hypothetical protein P280DRAFT_471325 [Massarina eburnea CBS 473.64]
MFPKALEDADDERTYGPEIILKFELDFMATLQDLRINILEFVRYTYPLDFDTQVTFSLECVTDEDSYEEEHTVELQELRKEFFPFLTGLMMQHPDFRNHDCTAIWVDGQGTPIQVCCAPSNEPPFTNMTRFYTLDEMLSLRSGDPDYSAPYGGQYLSPMLRYSKSMAALWYSLHVVD